MFQQIIDRRLAGKNKSIGNRERFLRRYKDQVKEAVKRAIDGRGIRDIERGEDIHIPKRDISEPVFGHGQGGRRETVHPGNQDYVRGDRIKRPQGGGLSSDPFSQGLIHRTHVGTARGRGVIAGPCRRRARMQVLRLGKDLADQGRADDRAPVIPNKAAVGLIRESRLGHPGYGQGIGQTEQQGEQAHRDQGRAKVGEHDF